MAQQRKTRFDILMDTYGIVGGTKVFAGMEDFAAKELLYAQLYKEVKKALGAGQKSIMGGVKKFNTQFVESELVKKSGLKPEEVFAKIVAASEKNWGSYPGVKDDANARKKHYDDFKAISEEVTAENIDEKFAALVSFAAPVKELLDVYRKINKTVVDNPMDAKNKLDELVNLTGDASSPAVQQVAQLIENYKYEAAVVLAGKQIRAAKKVVNTSEGEVVNEEQSRAERYEAAFLIYRRLGSISHFVEEGHDKLGTYSELATTVNNFVKATRVFEANVHAAYSNAVKDGDVNLFFENPNIDFEKVEKFIVAVERAESELIAAGVNIENIAYDSKNRVDAKALAEEMGKLTVRKAGPQKPQTREEFIISASKSFEILQRITEDK